MNLSRVLLLAGVSCCPLSAQVLTATATGSLGAWTNGGPTSFHPHGTAISPQLTVSSTSTAYGPASTHGSIRLDGSAHAVVLRTAVAAFAKATTSPPSSNARCVADVRLTLHATQPVWGQLVLDWSTSHWVPGAGSTAMVDVGEDGTFELQAPNSFPQNVRLPVAFGPGDLHIRMTTYAGATTNWFIVENSVGSELLVDLRPDPLTCQVQYLQVPCAGVPVDMETIGNFERGLDARITGLLPANTTIAALVLGSNRQSTVLPLPPFCRLLTDVRQWVLLVPAANGSAARSVRLPAALRPFSFHLQALALDTAAGTLRASGLAQLACP